MIGNADALVAAAKFDLKGLLPVIAQDRATGVVRMLAWANEEALRATINNGLATFWSRSRNELWEKGKTSGHSMRVYDVRLDCDADAVLYIVDANGPSCHTNATSCFFRAAAPAGLTEDDGPLGPPPVILSRLAEVIAQRQQESPDKSYVASLLKAGSAKINGKIIEEAAELCQALPAGDAKHTAHEAADLLFHMMVGLHAAKVPMDAVFAELESRFGTSGLTEKANRAK